MAPPTMAATLIATTLLVRPSDRTWRAAANTRYYDAARGGSSAG